MKIVEIHRQPQPPEHVGAYLAQHPLPFPVYLLDDDQAETLAFGTPSTLVVASGGRVIAGWSGAYLGHKAGLVQNFFKVGLPGVTAPPAAR